MRYLEKSFTFAVRSPRDRSRYDIFYSEIERQEQQRRAARPHEYEGGTMCGVCGLGREAKIHLED